MDTTYIDIYRKDRLCMSCVIQGDGTIRLVSGNEYLKYISDKIDNIEMSSASEIEVPDELSVKLDLAKKITTGADSSIGSL